MAKTSLKVKAARKPKFGVRATPGATVAVVRTRCTASSDCAACACASSPPWRTPRCHQEQLVKRTSQVPGNRRNRDEEGE